MANRWGIPKWLEDEVRKRDRVCIYCRRPFANQPPREAASWEHIVNDASIVTRDNIALCCRGCNASKGQKALSEWLQGPYCQKHGIAEATLAPVAQEALKRS